MGCFSFMCKATGKNVQEGEGVYLFLLKDGKVIEEQYGKYNLYGNVEGHEWKMPWNDVCRLMFAGNSSNGIAAVRELFFDGTKPVTRSHDDERQGCGNRKIKALEHEPYHKIYE